LQDRVADDDLMRRAEEALFGKPEVEREAVREVAREPAPVFWPADPAAPAQPQQPQRRILEAIVPEAEAEPPEAAAEPQPVRRGRKPGSKNRPKDEIPEIEAGKRRRGRPRKNPDSDVRSVAITPELASAALDSVSRAAPLPPAPAAPAPREHTAAAPVVAPKRPRGRPRKEKPAELLPATATPEEAPQAALAPAALSAARIVQRYSSGGEPSVGRRWTRRLRRYAHPDHVSRRLSRS
jgi:hypothetical protein